MALPDAPFKRLAKAAATCKSDISVEAVKVRPATVTELPVVRPLKVTAAFSVDALTACVVVTVGDCEAADNVKSVTLLLFVAVNITVAADETPLLHPVKVPVNCPVAPALE